MMSIVKSLKDIYKPKYIALNAAIAIAYYFVIRYLLTIQQDGIPITTVPVYLLYLLVVASSVTFTIAIYAILNTRRNNARISATSVSAVTTLAGGILSGCGCQAAILFNVLAVSIGAGQATLINTIATENAPLIFAIMIVINLFVSEYYLEKLSHPKCRLK